MKHGHSIWLTVLVVAALLIGFFPPAPAAAKQNFATFNLISTNEHSAYDTGSIFVINDGNLRSYKDAVSDCNLFGMTVSYSVSGSNGYYQVKGTATKPGKCTGSVTWDIKNKIDWWSYFTLTINPINENPTLELSAATVSENMPVGTKIGDITWADPDIIEGDTSTPYTLSISGGANMSDFYISSGALYTSTLFNYEAGTSKAVTLRVTDPHRLFTDVSYDISITNVNEVPSNISLSPSSVNENAAAYTTVGALSTSDPDAGNTFTYALVAGTGSTDNASFNILGANLRTSAVFDYEAKNSYAVRVRSTDQGGLYYDKALTVSVTDLKENSLTTISSDLPDPSVTGQGYVVSVRVAAAAGAGTPTGSVTVGDGAATCSAILSSGSGSCTLTSTTTGSKAITATYAGTSSWNTSSATSAAHTVNAANTSTSISSDLPDPSVAGQAYSVTFSVAATSPGSGTPGGSVTVSDGTTSCSSSLTNAAGSCSLTSATAGSKTLTTTYGGSTYYLGSSSTTTHTVNKSGTSTTISGDTPDPSVTGQAYTVSVNVAAASPGSGTPSGTVTVSDGSASCLVTLASGAGSCNLTSTTAGSKSISASYNGDGNFAASVASAATHTVNAASTSTSITSDLPDPSVSGQSYIVNVSVATLSPGSGTPTGTVTISNAASTCTATLTNGAGSCSLSSSTIGTKSISATYTGTTNFASSNAAAATHIVGKASTSTRIISDTPDPSLTGQPYSVSVTVSALTPGSGIPTGSVTVSDGSASCSAALTSGAGSCNLTSTSAGNKTISANYVGDANYATSTATTAVHTVNRASTSTKINSALPNPSVIGQNYTVSVTVSAVSPGGGAPAGTVNVSDGSNTCQITTLTSGSGSCSLPSTSVGTKTITASYLGNLNYSASAASSISHSVNKAASSTSITAHTPNPSIFAQTYSVSVRVAAVAPGIGIPTATVTVSNGTQTCVATLSGGLGACNLASGNAGSKTLTATYIGDAYFTGSTSASASHTVSQEITTTTITAQGTDPTVTGEGYSVSFSVAAAQLAAGTPTGSVTVSDGSQSCTGSLTAGSGDCILASLSIGTKDLTATYSGADNFSTSSGNAIHVVNKAGSTLEILDNPDPSEINTGFAVTVTVKAAAPGGGTPTGSVSVSDGNNGCTDLPLSNGSATCDMLDSEDLITQRPFDGTLSVTYSGDENYEGLGTAVEETHTYANLVPHLSIDLIESEPSVPGEGYTVHFSARATLPESSPLPVGSISITDPNGATCSGDLTEMYPGTAGAVSEGSCLLTTSSAGDHKLTAFYAGDVNFSSGKATKIHTVQKGETATSIVKMDPDTTVKTGQEYAVFAEVVSVSPATGTPTGEVAVNDGEGSSCSITLVDGKGSCNLSTFVVDPLGEISISSEYQGDQNYKSSSASAKHAINKADTALAITAIAAEPSVTGEDYEVSVKAVAEAPGSGNPAGSVTVSDGTRTCSATLANGAGSCFLEGSTPRTLAIQADYAGDDNYKASAATAVNHVIDLADTQTSIVSATPLSSVVGEEYAVSVSVEARAPGTGVPTGTVTVSDDAGHICDVDLASGVGSCNLPSTAAAELTLSAKFAGNSSFNESETTLAHTVLPASTSVSITTDDADPTVTGQAYSIAVKVETVTPGIGTPVGEVLVDDGSQSCTAMLSAGVGSCELTSTSAGNKTLIANYTGDVDFYASSSLGEVHSVDKAETSTSILTDQADPTEVGSLYTVSVSVIANAPGSGTPSGIAEIANGDSTCSAVLVDGEGSCELSADVVETNNIVASYVGDNDFNQSADTENHKVVNLTPTISITGISPNETVVGEEYTVSYRVAHAKGIPGGSVTILEGSGVQDDQCTGNLDGAGEGSCVLTSLNPGTKDISASYHGDLVFDPAETTLTHVVSKADSITTIESVNPDPSKVNMPYSVNVLVAAAAPGSGIPGGTVTVEDGSVGNNCEISLAAGQGSCDLSSSSSGSKTITATYVGDTKFNGSESAGRGTTVEKTAPTVTISSTKTNPSVVGQAYKVDFTVSHASNGTPSGTVTISDGMGGSCAGSLVGGVGFCSLSTATAGIKNLNGSYAGDSAFEVASANTTHEVVKAETEITLLDDVPNPSQTGQDYEIEVQVSALDPGAGTPGGVVVLDDGVGNMCEATLTAGTGKCTLTSFSVGNNLIQASYAGDGNYNSSSNSKGHTVVASASVTQITNHTPAPSLPGEGVTFTARVDPSGGGSGQPGGTVQIKSDGTVVCEATLAGGEASCSVPELSLGKRSLVAFYLGSEDYSTSVSESQVHYVDQISLDDNKTSTSFSVIGQFDNQADTAPFTYELKTSGRVCNAVNGADNNSFSVAGNTLQRISTTGAGTYTICVQSTDNNAGLIEGVFSISITDPPSMVGAGLDHNSVNTKQTEVGKFQAQGGQTPYVFGLQNSGTVCKSNNSSGNQYFTVAGNQLKKVPGTAVGTYPICFEVTDFEGEKAQKTATISVTAAPGGVSLSNNKVSTNQTLVGTLSMADGREPILYSLADSGKVCNDTNAADNGDFNTLNDQLQLNPGSAAGVRSICVQSMDVNSAVLQQDFKIYVTEPPSALTLSNTSLTVAQSLVGTLGTVDGQLLFEYKLANSGNVCNADNGSNNQRFSVLGNGLLRQPETPAGKYFICLQSTDANGGSIQQNFEISVSADTGGNPEWVAQVSSSKLINGDGPGTVVGQATSSIENARFEITDLAHFPFGALFTISPTGTITFTGTADDATEPYYPIRILVVAPDGSSRTLDTVIEVMRDGLKVGDLGVDDKGKVVRGGKVEIDVLANDVLGSHANRWVSHEIVQYPQNGKAWVGSIFYQSNKQFIGKDYLTYRACDNLRYCVMATLRIDVRAPFIPETGFSPNRRTELPKQAVWQSYQQASGLRISIAKLGLDTEIVGVPKNGDTWEVDWLGNSVGWLQGTAFPTWNGNSVITGHNTNPEGLPGTFAGLSGLGWNDEVVILYQGSRYVYQVREVSPRLPADRLDNVTEHREGAWITLVTCAGFDESTNSYLYRYVVRAMLVRVE